MATAPSPNDLTRQQLDELDALLQKMLTVPLAPVETPPPSATLPPLAQPPVWRVDPPATVPAPALAHLTAPEPPATLKFDPPPAPTPAPAAKASKPAPPPAPAPAPVVAPAPKPAIVAPAPKAAAAAVPVTPVPDVPPVPLFAIPFVALNGLFDSTVSVFGPLGRLLSSGFFKNLYGLTGLGLVVYTALHVAQVQGWLTLPIQLPWPK